MKKYLPPQILLLPPQKYPAGYVPELAYYTIACIIIIKIACSTGSNHAPGAPRAKREPCELRQLKYWGPLYFNSTLQATHPGFSFNYPTA